MAILSYGYGCLRSFPDKDTDYIPSGTESLNYDWRTDVIDGMTLKFHPGYEYFYEAVGFCVDQGGRLFEPRNKTVEELLRVVTHEEYDWNIIMYGVHRLGNNDE